PDAERADLLLVRAFSDPDADATLGAMRSDPELGEGADHPAFECMDKAADVAPALFEVEHHVADALPRAVIGVSAAASRLENREVERIHQLGGIRAGARREQRRMLKEPYAFACRAGADRRGALVHEGERLLIGDRRLAHAPFNVGRHFVHDAAGDGEQGAREQALRDARRLRITARYNGEDSKMSSLSISTAWEEARTIIVRDGKLLVTVALALIVLPEAILAVIGPPAGPQASALSAITYIVAVLLGVAAQIALNRLAIGPAVTVGSAIATGFRRLASVAVVAVLVGIAIMVVAVLLLLI